ncbi:hypothetical protein [Methylobacterium sp. SyP6R]|uniref:hypothetical protein n=1 Tax=Methylobacterium sp. SyP6R TaxID=2718876 RepID=UPI001F42A0B8|nr:hypothetical protein [Methylobacterium sp. SyP6R]MCF4130266.1 hypothetical protein [Methylobacterium sp. SyP6R]
MASIHPRARIVLSAAREAVRLLDAVLCGAAPDPGGNGFAIRADVTARVLDRITLWLAARPAPPPASACPLAAAQREAADLLTALIERLETVRPLPSGGVELRFASGAALFDRLMVWGAAIEDMEVSGEDDEDGADAEPIDYWPDRNGSEPGAAATGVESRSPIGLLGGIQIGFSTYRGLDALTF